MKNESDLEFSKFGRRNFEYLFKIGRVNLNKVTFKKYSVETFENLDNDNMITIKLKDDIGEEVYEVTPEVNLLLAGHVGSIIKGFKGVLEGKKKKKFIVNEIIEI